MVIEYIRYRVAEGRLDDFEAAYRQAAQALQMMDAADEVKLPDDPEFRAAFASYLEWGSRLALHNSQPAARPVLEAPVPHWGWGVAPPYSG